MPADATSSRRVGTWLTGAVGLEACLDTNVTEPGDEKTRHGCEQFCRAQAAEKGR